MLIKVKVSDWFKKFTNGETEIEMNLSGSHSITDIIDILKIPIEEVGFATKNNIKCQLDELVLDNDSIKIYPYIIGG